MHLIAVLFFVSGLVPASTSPSGSGAARDAAIYLAAETLAKREYDLVRKQLREQPKRPWQGEYYEGDHLGFNLRLAISSGAFAYTLHSDMGFLGAGHGVVRQVSGGISLQFSGKQNSADRGLLRGELDQVLVPVRWGGRHYLIAQRDFLKFASSINHGVEPDEYGGLFLLRLGDEKVVPKSLEGVPQGITKFVYSTPVETAVVGFKKLAPDSKKPDFVHSDRYRLDFDKGAAQGLVTGIELWISKPNNTFATVVLDHVDADSASGVYDTIVGNEPVPKRGWTFTTGQYPRPSSCPSSGQ